jgi:hypothetical protein
LVGLQYHVVIFLAAGQRHAINSSALTSRAF